MGLMVPKGSVNRGSFPRKHRGKKLVLDRQRQVLDVHTTDGFVVVRFQLVAKLCVAEEFLDFVDLRGLDLAAIDRLIMVALALALGAMLIFGVAYLVAQGLADAAPAALTRRTSLASLVAAAAWDVPLPRKRRSTTTACG